MKNLLSILTYSVHSIPDVLLTLTKLDKTLPNTPMENLKVFNHTYRIITQNVYEEIKNNGFNNTKIITQLDTNFASYYFDALKKYNENTKIAPAWQIAFDYCKNKKSYRLVYLMLAANAHINNDLAFSLFTVVKNKDFYPDYKKAGAIITSSIGEIMHSLNQLFPPRNFLDKHATWLYELIIILLIKKWRKDAWDNSIKLHDTQITKQSVEKHATYMANRIIYITNIIMIGDRFL